MNSEALGHLRSDDPLCPRLTAVRGTVQQGWVLTVCGVLAGRAVCAEGKLFWWLERELENKTEARPTWFDRL